MGLPKWTMKFKAVDTSVAWLTHPTVVYKVRAQNGKFCAPESVSTPGFCEKTISARTGTEIWDPTS